MAVALRWHSNLTVSVLVLTGGWFSGLGLAGLAIGLAGLALGLAEPELGLDWAEFGLAGPELGVDWAEPGLDGLCLGGIASNNVCEPAFTTTLGRGLTPPTTFLLSILQMK